MHDTAVTLPNPLVLHLGPLVSLNEDAFFEFCKANGGLRIERTSEGEILVMPPLGAESGNYEFNLGALLGAWVLADGSGLGFSSNTGFRLANGAVRSPDAAWITRVRWDAVAERDRQRFAPICPDFVAELRSATDPLASLQAKMQEYLDNGARLGWLIDPLEKKVYVYRPGEASQCLENPATVSGAPVMPGFTLELARLWSS